MGDLLLALERHNARPSHLHVMIDAPGFHKLTTALYFEGDPYLSSDVTFGVKKSLVVVSLDRSLAVVARVLLIRVITRACPASFPSFPWFLFREADFPFLIETD